MTKTPKRGNVGGQGQIFEIGNPFRKFGTGVAGNFKFGIYTDLGMSNLMHDKILPKGAW